MISMTQIASIYLPDILFETETSVMHQKKDGGYSEISKNIRIGASVGLFEVIERKSYVFFKKEDFKEMGLFREGEESGCSICLEDFKKNTFVGITCQGMHTICKSCFTASLKTENKRCPFCRRDIPTWNMQLSYIKQKRKDLLIQVAGVDINENIKMSIKNAHLSVEFFFFLKKNCHLELESIFFFYKENFQNKKDSFYLSEKLNKKDGQRPLEIYLDKKLSVEKYKISKDRIMVSPAFFGHCSFFLKSFQGTVKIHCFSRDDSQKVLENASENKIVIGGLIRLFLFSHALHLWPGIHSNDQMQFLSIESEDDGPILHSEKEVVIKTENVNTKSLCLRNHAVWLLPCVKAASITELVIEIDTSFFVLKKNALNQSIEHIERLFLMERAILYMPRLLNIKKIKVLEVRARSIDIFMNDMFDMKCKNESYVSLLKERIYHISYGDNFQTEARKLCKEALLGTSQAFWIWKYFGFMDFKGWLLTLAALLFIVLVFIAIPLFTHFLFKKSKMEIDEGAIIIVDPAVKELKYGGGEQRNHLIFK
eukprot:GHVN01047042.1.p1 GENE.GHVN01047042.1~~GHVN01047042.1.p1  ORF type:complete len:539 (+),score=21.10 GHVN01047042.1:6-1622(+)